MGTMWGSRDPNIKAVGPKYPSDFSNYLEPKAPVFGSWTLRDFYKPYLAAPESFSMGS